MPFQSKPTSNGVYRIRVLNKSVVIESVPGENPYLTLATPKLGNNKQLVYLERMLEMTMYQWNLTLVSGQTDVWTITSVEDQSGLVSITDDGGKYLGHGYPYVGKNKPSDQWRIIEKATVDQPFSKIKLEGDSEYTYFDACIPDSNDVSWVGFEKLDVLFIQDCTGSQQPYINTVRNEIRQICTNIEKAGQFAPGDLRFGLIAFRDHPPQDDSWTSDHGTKQFEFVSDVDLMAANLATLSATGGGDGPEAQTEALYAALNAPWEYKAARLAVLITDSPPHAIGEVGDGLPDGYSTKDYPKHDPLTIGDALASQFITLSVIACEPTLSNEYKLAHSFYKGLAKKTGGKLLNLGHPSALTLTDLIVGSALETVDSDALVSQCFSVIRQQLEANDSNAEAISKTLHDNLLAANAEHYTLTVEDIYEPDEQGERNVQTWFEAKTLEKAKEEIQVTASSSLSPLLSSTDMFLAEKVTTSRIKEQYLFNGSVATSVEKQPISLAQAQSIVQKIRAGKL
ncbi:hypothetical protein HWV62_15205 [Athelia sp. TMB]|nr:hypothetical protein HWV62_15205 [Athelia sp. TMB]